MSACLRDTAWGKPHMGRQLQALGHCKAQCRAGRASLLMSRPGHGACAAERCEGCPRTILFLSYSTARRPCGSIGSAACSTGMKLCSSSVLYPDCRAQRLGQQVRGSTAGLMPACSGRTEREVRDCRQEEYEGNPNP